MNQKCDTLIGCFLNFISASVNNPEIYTLTYLVSYGRTFLVLRIVSLLKNISVHMLTKNASRLRKYVWVNNKY